jgi:hypothetical protein
MDDIQQQLQKELGWWDKWIADEPGILLGDQG